ncbi:hypothetical protein PhaeoP18_02922 [Phaeobacter piscinae]|uniref:DUF6473 domain-containing protein n=1 Tax=Phaeobacter piscinae TaxID=1580596 RepID=A0AAN1GTL1_9RHOB|nr:DUF6473 family protein [Phaeobacter piscinae]ATG44843.1 hypothetical protein PhaeoP13_02943 [Phaeobacter piscinae]AUQ73018.1 hypothetical protein PhaeoP71_00113 [Phaeobacter piscinae]AUR37157.1 hypothetical protein PhaeoP18_02922 [Phaeobacter piscinae]
MSYELKSATALAGEPCSYAGSKLLVRGPARNLTEPYLAFIGGTEVFGRFVERPFVSETEALLDRVCVNLGSVNAGVDSFLSDPDILEIAGQAETTLLQVLGAQNISNGYYKVHPRRNDRFLCAHEPLLELYPEVDFTEYHFNKHLLSALRSCCTIRYETVRDHLQDTWVERMGELISALNGAVTLLWVHYDVDQQALFGHEPALVDRPMVDALRARVLGVLEIPVHTARDAADIDGMFYGQLDLPSAQRMLGPKEHLRIAQQVAQYLQTRLTT